MRIPAFVALMMLASRLAAAGEPELVVRTAGLTLRHLPPVFSEEIVSRHLDTGLTTSFVFQVTAGRGRALEGAAQVRIRYDLWDERYVIERWDARPGSPATATRARSGLGEWWRSLELVVTSGVPPLVPPASARITLRVLPFSQAEQRDAQDWLLRSFQDPRDNPQPAPAGGRAAATESAPIRNIYGSMLAASIGQRSLIKYSWTVTVTTESR